MEQPGRGGQEKPAVADLVALPPPVALPLGGSGEGGENMKARGR